MLIEARFGRHFDEVRVDGRVLYAYDSQRIWNHSPDGFAWGYYGSGPAQLALALLLHAGVDRDVAVRLHQQFKNEFIAPQPFNGNWSLDLDITAWVTAKATATVTQLQLAESIARRAHSGQKERSTGDDYVFHLQRVVNLVHSYDAKIVAWLHDVVEDTSVTYQELTYAGISAQCVAAVVWLTHNKELTTYAHYIAAIKDSKNALAIEVKIADLRDHLRPNCPPELRARYERALQSLTSP